MEEIKQISGSEALRVATMGLFAFGLILMGLVKILWSKNEKLTEEKINDYKATIAEQKQEIANLKIELSLTKSKT